MRAPGCGALLGVPPFWIRHLKFLSKISFSLLAPGRNHSIQQAA
jgi:hypothetical protein